MPTDKRCGTCDWFLKYNDKTVKGSCMWFHNTLTPYWMSTPQSLDENISKNGGINCPCWKGKQNEA